MGSTDNCSISNITVAPNSFDCGDIGEHEVLINVYDGSGNISYCNAFVTIIDTITELYYAQDIDLILDGTGNIVLDPEDIYTGSGGCGGNVDASLEVIPNTFDCGDLGINEVQLIVTDNTIGESDTCSAFVTVTDTINHYVLYWIKLFIWMKMERVYNI
ncbi:MAG: hypothetical protein R2771_07385 [Saprospiraceae bacterium]